MSSWFLQIGIYHVGLWLVFLGSMSLLYWGLFGDRSKGRRRCPRCWYDMRGSNAIVCSECGHNARLERRLFKNRRRWWAILPGIVLLIPSGFLVYVAVGWYREQPAIRSINPDIDRAWGVAPGIMHSFVNDVRTRAIGPKWIIDRLPAQFAMLFDRVTSVNHGGYSLAPEKRPKIFYFQHFKHIEYLRLPSITNDAELVHIRGLTKLRRFDLGGAEITGAGMVNLAGLTNLRYLDLSRTKVTTEGLESLRHLTNIRSLNLDRTKVDGKGLQYLSGNEHLEALSLSQLDIEDDHLLHLLHLRRLEHLDVSHTTISDNGLKHLGRMKQLRNLWIISTAVSDIGLSELEGLRNLEDLWVAETDVTPAGVARLQDALPNCKIKGP